MHLHLLLEQQGDRIAVVLVQYVGLDWIGLDWAWKYRASVGECLQGARFHWGGHGIWVSSGSDWTGGLLGSSIRGVVLLLLMTICEFGEIPGFLVFIELDGSISRAVCLISFQRVSF